jgi:hypothetical protein
MAAILTQLDSVTNGFRVPGEDLRLHYASPWMLPTYVANVALGKLCYAPDGLLRSEFTIYAGMAGTALALAGAIRGFGNRWIRFLSIFALVALMTAFVKPLAQLALQIPFLNLSMPARWVYIFGFCLTMLAAAGVDALAADRLPSTRIIAAFGFLSTVSVAFFDSKGAVVETVIGAFFALSWIVSVWKKPDFAPGLLVAAIAFDLIPSFVCFNSHADPAILDRKFASIDKARSLEKDPWRSTGNPRMEGAEPPQINPWTAAIGSNILALYGVETVMGYESIAPLSTVVYCAKMGGPQTILGSGRVLLLDNPDSPMAAIANLRYLFNPYGYVPAEGSFGLVGTWPPVALLGRTDALPRAYLVDRCIQGDADAAAASWSSIAFDRRNTVILEEAPLPRTTPGGGTVSWLRRETDRIELAVEAKGDSILVVSDTDYPGWVAEVDGVETPILRANITFRAIAVQAGSHQVVMRFRPASARNGLVLTTLTLVAILAYCGRRKAV